MEPNNPKDPTDPEMPQPLNTSFQIPTEIPMGEPTPPAPPQSGGLPPQLPSSPQVSKPSGNSGMLIMMGIIAVILIILGVGGYYFYTNMGIDKNNDGSDTKTAQELIGLEGELNSIEVTDPQGDLVEIDQEISLLEATPSSR